MDKKTLLSAAFVAAVGTMISGAPAVAADKEKCLGVAKAGKNDCGSTDGRHDCSGKSTKDGDPTEWVYLPEGVCDKLVNGKVYKPGK
jgi:uncharacterized membrane protein